MLPPKYTKTLTVVAKDGPADVTAKYSGNQGEEEVSVQLQAEQSHTFPEKSEDMGTWTAVKKIVRISGTAGGKPFSQEVEEHCEGVHGNIQFSVHAEHGVQFIAKD